ncbi:hypothetical protein MNBD_GAMMA22-1562 [hydrothermal vent metagenome]|uniref:Flagellar protein FliL n=1 Tax=hydrothermal vent metagenome TaxID=652676 RepID=A0A3B0ZWU1_9ZZZZ
MIKVILCLVLFFIFSPGYSQSGGSNPSYFSIEPPIVVNVYHPDRIKFLQVDTQVKVNDSSVIDAIEFHKPAIRHAMLMLLSSQKIDEMKTVKGKEKLRKEALRTIKKVLKENTGNEGVTELYFTGFIIQ